MQKVVTKQQPIRDTTRISVADVISMEFFGSNLKRVYRSKLSSRQARWSRQLLKRAMSRRMYEITFKLKEIEGNLKIIVY